MDDLINSFVTYKYARIRRPAWLGQLHFVLRNAVVVGIILWEVLFRSNHLRYEAPMHQPIPLWVERPDVADEVAARSVAYCHDGGPPCREWEVVDDDDTLGRPLHKDALFVTTQWVESRQRRRQREECAWGRRRAVRPAAGEGGDAAPAADEECGTVWVETARDVYRAGGVEEQLIRLKPAYVATSWSVYAGYLEVVLPWVGDRPVRERGNNPRDISLRLGDILKAVTLYDNELKSQELGIIVRGLREKGLDYLLEADELYEYDGATQTLRQNGLTLALELKYSNTSPFDFFMALGGQGSETFPWRCEVGVRLVGYTEVRVNDYIYTSYPSDRVVLQRSGIHFIVSQKGLLGQFDFTALVLVLVTGMGLMNIATKLVELLAMLVPRSRDAHRRFLIEEDVDERRTA